METPPRMPYWAIGIIVVLAAIEPQLHLWIPHDLPADTRWSGLHTVDTYAYLTAMEHAASGYSPYARCTSPVGDTDPSLYALPHHVMYGMIGSVGRMLHLPPFFWLGLVNGLSAAFLLWAAWRLLRAAVPDLARTAFLFFALGGGLGGVGYGLAWITGWTDSPNFAMNFDRFAAYELTEGARFQPWLLLSRIYYSFPMGVGFLALTALLRHLHRPARWTAMATPVLFFLCAFMNFRLGPMMWVVAVLYLLCTATVPLRQRWITAAWITPATLAGVLLALRWLSANPELSESALRALSGQMWLLPFVYATALYWLVLPASIRRGVADLPPLARVLGKTGVLFAAVYTALYLGYQIYYGNLLRGGDTSAAIAASDPALLIAVAYGLLQLARMRPTPLRGSTSPLIPLQRGTMPSSSDAIVEVEDSRHNTNPQRPTSHADHPSPAACPPSKGVPEGRGMLTQQNQQESETSAGSTSPLIPLQRGTMPGMSDTIVEAEDPRHDTNPQRPAPHTEHSSPASCPPSKGVPEGRGMLGRWHTRRNPGVPRSCDVRSKAVQGVGMDGEPESSPGSTSPLIPLQRGTMPGMPDAVPWFALWFLAFFCIAIAAFGDGWFLQFTPQRFMVVLALPMAVLAAAGVQRIGVVRPRRARQITAGIVACGVVSILVTWFGSYGPLGYHGLQQHYPQTRWAYISEADASLLDALEDDTNAVVLAPALTHPILGDVAVQRGHRAVYGNGTLDFSREVMPFVREAAHTFFHDPAQPDATRRQLIDDWCVTHVYCPDGEPIPDAMRAHLDTIPWLERVTQIGNGALYRVIR